VNVVRDGFGFTSAGEPVDRYTVDNGVVRLQAITYGGIITSLVVPDRTGQRDDIALGFDSLHEYERASPYFGAIVGRYANRLAHGRFRVDQVTHQVATNEGAHHLHGGRRGFDKRMWEAQVRETDDGTAVVFSRVSVAGEEGYPGTLAVRVIYTISAHQLRIEYRATTSAPTIVNLTQHTYFDLSAGVSATIDDHILMIAGKRFTAVDGELIPTGAIAPVAGTPLDFRTPQRIGARIGADDPQLRHGGGYDHNWVLDDLAGGAPAATVFDQQSGRTLTIHTTEPGLQFYSGNRLSVPRGKSGRAYPRRSGFCLETQHFPDSPSHPHFPSTVLRPGQTFRSQTTWTFGCQ